MVFNANLVNEIQGIRLSPLGVVEELKLRIIHDLTSAGSGNRSSVNEDTDFDCAPPCELGHVLRDALLRVLYLRQKHGPRARIVLSRIDVKGANCFRQHLDTLIITLHFSRLKFRNKEPLRLPTSKLCHRVGAELLLCLMIVCVFKVGAAEPAVYSSCGTTWTMASS